MPKRAQRCLELLLYAGAIVGGGWLLLRFVLPCLAPFLLAFLLAAAIEPAVRGLCRLRVRRGAAAGMVTLALLALLTLLLTRLVTWGFGALSEMASSLPELMSLMEERFTAAERWLLRYAESIPGGADYLEIALDAIANALTDIPLGLSRTLLDAVTRMAQRSPDVLLFLVTAGLGSFFLSASLPKVKAFLLSQLPASWLRQMDDLGRDLKQSFGGWFRAQMILMVITFAELLAAFLILRVQGAGLIAGVTAVVDALPVFGVGIVLLPWAAAALLRGETVLGLGLVVAYAVISLVRSCLQAKLVGDQIGLNPLSSLLAVYVGWKLCGVWGVLLFPLLLVTLQQLNDRGVLHLWKQA